jgi:HEAT repeat protein
MTPMDPATTDAQGRYEVAVPDLPFSVFAMDAEGRRGGVAVARTAGETPIALAPLVKIEARLHLTDPETPFQNGSAHLATTVSEFAVCRTRTGTVTFLAPPGEYVLLARAEDAEPVERPVTVPAGATADLGTVDLPPSALATSYGKAPPAVTAVDRDGRDVGLDALRGRWVLLAFWSHASPPSVRETVPAVAAFRAAHATDADLFEVVLLHEPSVTSFQDLDLHLRRLAQAAWQGKVPAVPMWLDATGETAKRWGVRGFPTVHLVDPDGHLVRGGNLEVLDERLREGDPDVNRAVAGLAAATDLASARPHLDALSTRRNRHGRAALVTYARAAPPDRKAAALDALGVSGGADAVAFLAGEHGLASKDPVVAAAAARALGRTKDAAAKAPLLAAVADRKAKPAVVEAAVLALADLDPADAAVQKALLEASRSTTVEVRVAAVSALGKVPTTAAFDRLVFLLEKDISLAVKVRAIESLASTGKPEAKAVLKVAADTARAKTVREAAAAALARMP